MLIAILLAGIAFYEAFVALRILDGARAMATASRESFAVVQSDSMSDEDKAVAMRRGGVAMFRNAAVTTFKLALAVGAAALLLYFVSLVRWSFEDLAAYSIRPLPLIATCVLLVAYGKLRHGRRK